MRSDLNQQFRRLSLIMAVKWAYKARIPDGSTVYRRLKSEIFDMVPLPLDSVNNPWSVTKTWGRSSPPKTAIEVGPRIQIHFQKLSFLSYV